MRIAQEKFLIRFWDQWNRGADKIALLRHYTHIRWKKTPSSRVEFQRSGLKWETSCQVCGDNRGGLHRHHIIPLALHGDNIQTNLVTLCRYCHKLVHGSHKHAKILREKDILGPPRLVKKSREGQSFLDKPSSDVHI